MPMRLRGTFAEVPNLTSEETITMLWGVRCSHCCMGRRGGLYSIQILLSCHHPRVWRLGLWPRELLIQNQLRPRLEKSELQLPLLDHVDQLNYRGSK